MKPISRLVLILLAIVTAVTPMVATTPLAAQEDDGTTPQSSNPPLFASHSILEFTLSTDFDELKKDRGQESEDRPAEITFANGDAPVELQVKTRGRFRLERTTCPDMPPIRLNFPKKAVRGTLFDGQDKVKLVTHCRNGEQFEQNTLKEYLVYRTYGMLTELSLGVRLARITYVDTSGKNDPVSKFAFIIEHEDGLADRTGGTLHEPNMVDPNDYLASSLLRLSLFQHLIGNTDYSAFRRHNVLVLSTPDGDYHPIPYDFDWSGFVNARYAKPDPSLGIRNVRQRVFRGMCLDSFDYDAGVGELQVIRDDLISLIEEASFLTSDVREKSVEYVREYYQILDSPEQVDRRIVRACRPM